MSNINIRRAVDNMGLRTTAYTPIVELIVNAIQAIDETGRNDGKVHVRVLRSAQLDIEGNLPEIVGFEIEDNGVGFTDSHRRSFDTLYSDTKLQEGGKGFGRFTVLRYFEDMTVRSVYRNETGYMMRCFSMGKVNDIIVEEIVSTSEAQEQGTKITVAPFRSGRTIDKKLKTIARSLVEKLLPYFITKNYACPDILLSEHDGAEVIRLNDHVSNELSALIREIDTDCKLFRISCSESDEEFSVRAFRIYSPGNQKSRISLVAHKREVSSSPLDRYVPEFIDDFYEQNQNGETDKSLNFIVKVYVFGPYLDRHVSLERGGFEFPMDANLLFGIGQAQIERNAANIARDAMGADIKSRQDKKKERIQDYVDNEAPWHKTLLNTVDLSEMPYKATYDEVEAFLQKEKSAREIAIKRDVKRLLSESHWLVGQAQVQEIVNRASDTSKNDLIHYIALRRIILDVFEKSLESDSTGSYSSEGLVHDIIFPRKHDTDTTPLDEHNLWLVDERLNFTRYVASDLTLKGKGSDRPDLIAYDKPVLFRGDNELSDPITIFEFKKPKRDNFADRSSKEDPVEQVLRYVNDIKDGKYTTPEGRKILVSDSTPAYGYIVCDPTPKVVNWIERVKNFTPMPDGLGWFDWFPNSKLYLEVVSWDKVLKDARKRNQIFFHKLGI